MCHDKLVFTDFGISQIQQQILGINTPSYAGNTQPFPLAQGGNIQPPSSPFPPINYNPVTNYISAPTGDSSGMTSDGGLNLYLILGFLAVAAFAVFMVIR